MQGKGYPDLSTQQLLRRMADTFPEARFYALVDADPHGIDIMSVYKHGSRANAHSSSHDGLGLGDRLQWLGVKASEWPKLGRYNDLLPLGERDTQMVGRTKGPADSRQSKCVPVDQTWT